MNTVNISFEIPESTGIDIETLKANVKAYVNRLLQQAKGHNSILLSDEELDACVSVGEMGNQLRAMVHDYYSEHTK